VAKVLREKLKEPTAEPFESDEPVMPLFCRCGATTWHTRPSGDVVCKDCARPQERLTPRQPRP
jgi:hypothetical protein